MNETNGSKGLSIAAMIFGILGILCCCIGFPFAIIGLILAIIALAKKKAGKGMAIAGLIMSIITLIVSIMCVVSLIPMAPYMDSYMDFINHAPEYIEEYEEDGTYPPFIEDMIDDGIISEEDAEMTMDKMVEAFKSAPANTGVFIPDVPNAFILALTEG